MIALNRLWFWWEDTNVIPSQRTHTSVVGLFSFADSLIANVLYVLLGYETIQLYGRLFNDIYGKYLSFNWLYTRCSVDFCLFSKTKEFKIFGKNIPKLSIHLIKSWSKITIIFQEDMINVIISIWFLLNVITIKINVYFHFM